MTVRQIEARLRELSDPEYARFAPTFFKTGPGEYGEGDRFLGVRVPQIRKLVREYAALPRSTVERLLHSPLHESRLLALLILVHQFARADEPVRNEIYGLYFRNTRYINNWDLVDASAEHIVGGYLARRSRRPLMTLARSRDLWKRRIAAVATFHFIRRGEFQPTMDVAEQLLDDREDLIHKAVGWMLREVGKRDTARLEQFLRTRYRVMPRTMLRYAIERFPEARRKRYLQGKIR